MAGRRPALGPQFRDGHRRQHRADCAVHFSARDYDAIARDLHDTRGPEGIFVRWHLTAALFSDAMADASPLAETIAHYADEKMFSAIAEEYRKRAIADDRDHRPRCPAIGDLEFIGAWRTAVTPKPSTCFCKVLLASVSPYRAPSSPS